MTLRVVDGSPGAPWERELAGRLDHHVVESELLEDNPLGDSARRPLYVYLPPGFDDSKRYPTIYMAHYYGGRATFFVEPQEFEPRVVDRIDDLFASGDVPPAIVVVPDAWTKYGGSEWINSVSTGPYLDYVCDEVVPFVDERYPTIADRDHRGITGHSSGGYAALVLPMLRRDLFGALVSQASEALFEHCFRNDFAAAAKTLRDRYEGSYEAFLEAFETADPFDRGQDGTLLELYAMATCWSPDGSKPGRALLPFDLATGEVIEEVWERWLAWDPVRLAGRHLDELRSMRYIGIEAGRRDEYYLDLGALALARVLESAGIPHDYEIFEGRHGGIRWRYPLAVAALARALSE